MKRDAFAAKGLRIETSVDWTSRWYVVWKPDVSVYCRTRKEVLKFASWPIKTPTGDSLRAWLDQLEAIDQERVSKKAQPLTGWPLMEGKGAPHDGPGSVSRGCKDRRAVWFRGSWRSSAWSQRQKPRCRVSGLRGSCQPPKPDDPPYVSKETILFSTR